MANTKIELEHPYDERWKTGYLSINNDGRRTLSLYNSHTDRSSTQYARYLVAVKLGRFLESTEHVDHKDEDKTNDNIGNLQILTLKQNSTKSKKMPDENLICPICMIAFTRTRTQLRGKLHKLDTVCCSRKCGGKYSHVTKRANNLIGKVHPS